MKKLQLVALILLGLALTTLTRSAWQTSARALPARATISARVSVQAAGRGNPWINLQDGHELLTDFGGAGAQALQANQAEPLALASADFDEDGVPDLLSSYTAPNLLALQRGNIDSIWPDTAEAQQRRATGEFTDAPFLSPARVFALPAAPQFIGAGDFNADGHQDVVLAAAGGRALYWLAGNGRGKFAEAQAIKLPGAVTALAVGEVNRADGLADVVVGVVGADGAQALVFEGPQGALLREPEVIALPAAATAIALGQLDKGYEYDVALATGAELLIVSGRDRQQAEVTTARVRRQSLPFVITALALGTFSGGQHNELALLGADGAVRMFRQSQPGAEAWGEQFGEAVALPAQAATTTSGAAASLVSAKVSSRPGDDLIVVDRAKRQTHILMGEVLAQRQRRAAVSLDVEGEPVALLPMRLNKDALSDLVVLQAGGAPSVAVAMTAPLQSFTVNSSGDAGDINPGDGKCETAANNGVCTLRAAIQEANRNAGADEISIAVTTVNLTNGSLLPVVSDAVTIAGVSGRVTVDGTNASRLSADGLSIFAANSTVRGMLLTHFSGDGIKLGGTGNIRIEGNFLLDNDGNGLQTQPASETPNCVIGGTVPEARNVISGNKNNGISLNQRSSGAQVLGNYIGTDAAGTRAQGNRFNGVKVDDPTAVNIIIGGTDPAARNLISSNLAGGIYLNGNAVMVLGNSIGVGAGVGGLALGNGTSLGQVGVYVQGKNNKIDGNIIANSSGDGVSVSGAGNTGNAVRRNAIYANIRSGILAYDDPDIVLDSSFKRPVLSGGASGLQGTITGRKPSTTHIIDFFSNTQPCVSTSFGQGEKYLSSITVTTDSNGRASFVAPGGQNITATATTADNNTSGFSRCASGESDEISLDEASLVPKKGLPLAAGTTVTATVNYKLLTRDEADLALRLFDDKGNLQGSSGVVSARKSDGARSLTLFIPNVSFTPGTTIVRLKAVFIDRAQPQVFKESQTIEYSIAADSIKLENPKIDNRDAANGQEILNWSRIAFLCDLRYLLASDAKGGYLSLQAYDISTATPVALGAPERKQVSQTLTEKVDGSLILGINLPREATKLRINAELLNAALQPVATAKVEYPLKRLRFDLGTVSYSTSGTRFNKLANLPVLISGKKIWEQLGLGEYAYLALKAAEDLNVLGLAESDGYESILVERLTNGNIKRESKNHNIIHEFPRPFVSVDQDYVKDDADQWQLQVKIAKGGNRVTYSEPVVLQVDRVRINSANPLDSEYLTPGSTRQFTYRVEYNINRPGTSRIVARLNFGLTLGSRDITLATHSAPTNKSAGENFTFNVEIPPNARILSVRMLLIYDNPLLPQAASTDRFYPNVKAPPTTVPAGAQKVASILGADISTVVNAANQSLVVSHTATVINSLSSTLLQQPAGAALARRDESGASQTPFNDFIGINSVWRFEPPIPTDSKFVADLTLHYNAEDLPDDPNFNEANLKVVSFNPATGQMETFATTLDRTAKTATARINGLAPFYTLGVFGPFSNRTLNFPALGSELENRLVLLNPGMSAATLRLNTLTSDGVALSGAGITNPITLTLAAGQQLARRAEEFFSLNPLLNSNSWTQTRADKLAATGYQLLGSGNRVDGLAVPNRYAPTVVLPGIEYDARYTTEVQLSNPTNFPSNLTLELRTETGAQFSTYETTLAPKGRFAEAIQYLFPAIVQPFTGYLLVRSDHDVAAVALLLSDAEIVALNGQPLPDASNTASKLYTPRIVRDGRTTATWLTLVNPTASTANLRYRATGTTFTGTAIGTLAPNQQLRIEAGDIFGQTPGFLREGTLTIESNITGLVGAVSYEDPAHARTFRAALPLVDEPGQAYTFAYLDNGVGAFTELALFNSGAAIANADVKVFRADGTQVGATARIAIAANTRTSTRLAMLVTASANQVGGYFTLTSDQPVVAGAVFGDAAGNRLAALPAQPLATTTTVTPRAIASVSAASYAGQQLASESIVAAFGTNLATSVIVADATPLPTQLAGTTVKVRDSSGTERLAPLFFVAPAQINYLIPAGTTTGTATITVTNSAGEISTGNVTIAPVAPGIFTANASGLGVPAAVIVRVANDGAQTFEAVSRFDQATQRFVAAPVEFTPSTSAIVLTLFGTGWRFRSAQTAAAVTIGGVDAPVLYVGAQPTLIGLDQLNVELPRSLTGRGDVTVVVTVDGKTANTVGVNIK